MRRTNVFRPDLDGGSEERDGYRRRAASVGKAIGGAQIGAGVYELPEGERSWPYHFHHGQEEWLIVLDGTPTLREPDGTRVLRRGDVVCFPTGPEGAHQVTGPGTVMILSSNRFPDVVHYPDSGKIGPRPGANFRAADAVEYWEGE